MPCDPGAARTCPSGQAFSVAYFNLKSGRTAKGPSRSLQGAPDRFGPGSTAVHLFADQMCRLLAVVANLAPLASGLRRSSVESSMMLLCTAAGLPVARGCTLFSVEWPCVADVHYQQKPLLRSERLVRL
jgi:hypothetical protein